jgi:hypothetical protein
VNLVAEAHNGESDGLVVCEAVGSEQLKHQLVASAHQVKLHCGVPHRRTHTPQSRRALNGASDAHAAESSSPPRQIGGKRVDGVGREQMRVGAVLKKSAKKKSNDMFCFVRKKTAQVSAVSCQLSASRVETSPTVSPVLAIAS